ncbi:GDSL-type esterase/lipase family protein [Streptomyces pratensis]|uniref:GDSL-type esterase/lipase family protein n=1 Tax=Streptomyces pratensis TaxID=1169025 RepID=UPI003015BA17
MEALFPRSPTEIITRRKNKDTSVPHRSSILIRRRATVASRFRLLAVLLSLALSVLVLEAPAQAAPERLEATGQCAVPDALETGFSQALQRPGTASHTAIRVGCAADAPQRIARFAAAADDVQMAFDTTGLDQRLLEEEAKKIQQAKTDGKSLSDVLFERAEKYKLGVYETSPAGVEFDGTFEATATGFVMTLPASEVQPDANWWQKGIAIFAGIAAGSVASVVCFAAFAVGAPPAVLVCQAVGGFVGGLVGELVNAAFDGRSFGDSSVWAEAFTVAILAAVLTAGGGHLMNWAQTEARPLFGKLVGAMQEFAQSVRVTFRTAITYTSDVLSLVGPKIYPGLVAMAKKLGIRATPTALQVMPLGDSITAGIGSPTTSSYRAALWDGLTADKHTVDFVGDRRSGQLPDTDHEGVSGDLISQIAQRADASVPVHRPNVVTLHAGTNDMDKNVDPAGAPDRIAALIDQIRADSPGVTVLVATLVPARNSATQSRINVFNREIVKLAQERQKAGQKVRAVSMDAVTAADVPDGLHPNDSGYRKMADAFHSAVDQSVLMGWVAKSQPGDLPACSPAANRWTPRPGIAKGGVHDIERGDDILFADVDGDGRDDYLVLNYETGALDAWLNRGGDRDGQPGWEERKNFAKGGIHDPERDDDILFADADGDGRDDYLVLNKDTGGLDAWLNRGGDRDGQPGWVGRKNFAAGGLHKSGELIALANVDCDLRVDYLVHNPDESVRAWLNRGGDRDGQPGWVERGQIASGIEGGNTEFADLDGDGRDDYLKVDSRTGRVDAYLNRGGDPA